MDILQEIAKKRKLKGLKWNDLAEGLPITGNALRMAFERGKVQPEYLAIIKHKLNLQNAQHEELGNDIIMESEIPYYIMDNEEKLMANKTFRLWLTTKIQEGIIKSLGEK